MHLGDVRDVLDHLAATGETADFAVTSPPFLALRSYLPAGHPDKAREIGSEPTPAAFLDTAFGWTAQLGGLLPEWASIAVEIGDTMAGSGGAGGDYSADGLRAGQPKFRAGYVRNDRPNRPPQESPKAHKYDRSSGRRAPGGQPYADYFKGGGPGGEGWPQPKSMCLIPHSYTFGLAYGHNPITGAPTPAGRWRIRNVIAWARPNPPVGSLGKRNPHTRTGDYKFRPATSFITVACRGTGRYFDLDAVRTELADSPGNRYPRAATAKDREREASGNVHTAPSDGMMSNPAGAPPLDWHADDLDGDWLWKLATAPYRGSHYACVDADTEVLTPDGWAHHGDCEDGDLIAAYDQTAGLLRWEPATFHRYDYDGDLVAIDQRETVQRLTPNHRVLTQRGVVRADELVSSHRVPLAASWEEHGTYDRLAGDMSALCGWWVAEGHMPPPGGQPRALIYQSESANPEHVATIRRLLGAVAADWRENRRERVWRGRPSVEVTFTIYGEVAASLRSFGKKIPASVLTWETVTLRRFYDALIDGDGHRRKADGRVQFITKSEHDADMFQAIAARLGHRSTIQLRTSGTYSVTVGQRATATLRGTNGAAQGTTLEHYTGTVWCPSVPSSFWLARRNGRPFITGNTFPLTLPRRLIAAMCPTRVCTVCGWPSERVTQRGERVNVVGRVDQSVWNPDLSKKQPGDHTGSRWDHLVRDGFVPGHSHLTNTVGWTDCGHDAWRPGRVIDPFGGSGTTAVAAALEHRDAILIDIDERNVELVRRRLNDGLRIVHERRHVTYRGRRKVAEYVEFIVDQAAPAQAAQVTGQTSLLDLFGSDLHTVAPLTITP